MFVIYEIKNNITNKRYIGSSKDYTVRWARHLNDLLNNKHHCIYLQRAFNKYGRDQFSFNVIQEISTRQEMLHIEESLLNSTEELYNISKSASGGNLITYHPNVESIKEKHRINYYLNVDPITGKHKYLNNALSGKYNPIYKTRKIRKDLV